jgi:hypothetical protein
MKASASLVADGAGITAIEYFDENYKKLVLQVFTGNAFYSQDIRICLHADANAKYQLSDKCTEGSDLCEDGILITDLHKNCCKTFVFEKI